MLYDKKFHSKRCLQRGWQKEVGKAFAKHFKITSVVDYGCSIGSYLEGFKDAGAVVKGYELYYDHSKYHTPKEILPYIECMDVSKSISTDSVECSFSIEVAEHIQPDTTRSYVHNLCRNSNRYVIMSAAPPGQGGVGHINCRPQTFWIAKMKSEGFVYSLKKTMEALKVLDEIKGVKKWVRSNLMVFERVAE